MDKNPNDEEQYCYITHRRSIQGLYFYEYNAMSFNLTVLRFIFFLILI